MARVKHQLPDTVQRESFTVLRVSISIFLSNVDTSAMRFDNFLLFC